MSLRRSFLVGAVSIVALTVLGTAMLRSTTNRPVSLMHASPAALVNEAVSALRASSGYNTTRIFDVNGDWNMGQGVELPKDDSYFWYQSPVPGIGQKIVYVGEEIWLQGPPFTGDDQWMSISQVLFEDQGGFYLFSPVRGAEELVENATEWSLNDKGAQALVDLGSADLANLGVSKSAYRSLSGASATKVIFEFDDFKRFSRYTISYTQPGRVIDVAIEFSDYNSPIDFPVLDPDKLIPFSAPE